MRKMFFAVTAFILLALPVCLRAQRYLTPQFSGVYVNTNLTYSINATVIGLAQAGQALPQPLDFDFYRPANDVETSRPLIILLHDGSFLLPNQNGGCQGSRKDEVVINLATRLAKMGYAVACINYRLGWNPTAESADERTYSWINAMYRGIQDVKSAVRFFKRDVMIDGNSFGIDPEKIVVWGIGTGGFIASAAATLDAVSDTEPKFRVADDFEPFKLLSSKAMIQQDFNGNMEATVVGITNSAYPYFPVGDTLCYRIFPGYESNFQMAVNMGGALADINWLDASDIPMISYHVPTDASVPCGTGNLPALPPTVMNTITVTSGSCGMLAKIKQLGLNAGFAGAAAGDPITLVANSRNGGADGLFLFPRTDNNRSPWFYAGSTNPYPIFVENANCPTDATVPNRYLDTVVQYFAPRAFKLLQLGPPCPENGPIVYVDANAGGSNDGSSWSNAFTSIDEAISRINNCGAFHTIHIAQGTYISSGSLSLQKLNAQLLGGYPSGGGTRNPGAYPVILKGDLSVWQSTVIDGVRVEKK